MSCCFQNQSIQPIPTLPSMPTHFLLQEFNHPLLTPTTYSSMQQMGKRRRLRFFSKRWSYCKQPMTHSFRASSDVGGGGGGETSYKAARPGIIESEDTVEAVIRGLRSERLMYNPGALTSSILEEANSASKVVAFAVALESEDPYRDFRASMEEMVVANGMKDLSLLEEMLCWYLRLNGRRMHGVIVGAFVDLLVRLAASPSPYSYHVLSSSSSSRFEV